MSQFKLSDWPVIFAEFVAAKAALQDAVSKERAKLDKATAEYEAAVGGTQAKADYDEARTTYNAFRRWCEGNHVRLTDPRVEAVPGVHGIISEEGEG